MSKHQPRDRVFFFDTTLRDGEQSPGCSMTIPEKLRMAHALEALGVDIIEAGFAIASPGDLAAINSISREVRGPRIASLARTRREDIEAAARSLEGADRSRIHVFLASSDIHLEHKLKITRAEALHQADNAVRLARTYVDDVEFSPEDSSRSDPDFLCSLVRVAIQAGATVINLPDTVGYCVPNEYGAIFRTLRERVPEVAEIIFLLTATTIWVWRSRKSRSAGRGRAADRVHHQRHRRKSRKCGARGSGCRHAGAPGQVSLRARAGYGAALPHQPDAG